MSSIVEEPFHEGERAVQERVGVRERLAEVGPHLMRAFLTEEHRAFFAELYFVVVGLLDEDGHPRATLLDGGATSPDPTTLAVTTLPSSLDPARARLFTGAPIGVLGLQPHTRRRNRVNGVVGAISEAGFVVDVQQTFGNCPKFIRARTATRAASTPDPKATSSSSLSPADIAWIRAADTFFIASAHSSAGDATSSKPAAHGVDVSHRGGKAGFVDVDDDGVLWVPDFQGNFYFNTLGNLVQHPRAGLVFFDQQTGGLLQLAADVEIVWDGSVVDAFAGAQRVLKMKVTGVVRIDNTIALRLVDGPPSPFSAMTGSW